LIITKYGRESIGRSTACPVSGAVYTGSADSAEAASCVPEGAAVCAVAEAAAGAVVAPRLHAVKKPATARMVQKANADFFNSITLPL
jgi:hypothetical protein